MEGATKEVNQHLLAARISNEIKDMLDYSSFHYELQKVTASDEVNLNEFKSSLLKCAKTGSLNVRLRNMVYHWLRERCIGFKPAYTEPLDYMKKAQETWENRIWKSLTAMAHELKTPLACGRLMSEQEAVEENWSELSQWDVGMISSFNYIPQLRQNLHESYNGHVSDAPVLFGEVIFFRKLILKKTYTVLVEREYFLARKETFRTSFTVLSSLIIQTSSDKLKYLDMIQTRVEFDLTRVTIAKLFNLSRFKPVYSPKDFLDCLLHIASPNYKGSEKLWGSLSAIPIKVKTLKELKCLFGDLTTGEPHYGLIRHLDSQSEFYGSYFSTGIPKVVQLQRRRLGDAVDTKGSAVVAQEFLKKGCPPALRGKLWQHILGSNITQEHREYYQGLKQAVVKSDLLIDRLILKDVQLTAANDDQYFVFEDSLHQVLLCFSRDVSLLDLFERSSKNPLTAVIKKNKGRLAEGSVIYPPNGVIPFHGFTMYVAPICYLFDEPECLYFTFRSMYIRYWFRLHEISSHENGIVALCILFEKLLHRHETQLWFHFRGLRLSPLRVVFKWLIKGFSGYLPAEQVLQLWDLILGYNSIQILSFFALGILSIRKENLMRTHSPQTVDAVLADLSSIAVLPVLQLVMYKESF